MISLLVLIAAPASLIGIEVARRARHWPLEERILSAVVFPLAALLVIDTFTVLRNEPLLTWNNIRLARTFALFHGIELYPSLDSFGPIIGTLHLPVSHVMYWPALFAPTPVTAVLAGSSIAFALVLASLSWIFLAPIRKGSQGLLIAIFALITCGYLLHSVASAGFNYCAYQIHTDAPALFFVTVAGGLLARSAQTSSWKRLLASSFCAVMAVGCKQTLAPALIAFLIFIYFAEGLQCARIYLLSLLASATALLAALCCFFPLRNLYFNTVILAAHRPLKDSFLIALVEAFQTVLAQCFFAVVMLFAFLLWFFTESDRKRTFRQLLSTHRWLVFSLAGVLFAPVGIKAVMTVGGGINHAGILSFFFVLSLTLGLKQFMQDKTDLTKRYLAISLSVAIIAFTLPAVVKSIKYNILSFRHETVNLQVAYLYTMKHPGSAYFPEYPLSQYYAEHRFYHFDGAIRDRWYGNHGLSQAQYAACLPANISLIAYSNYWEISETLRDYLKDWQHVDSPELTGWIVWQRPATTRN